MYVIVYFLCFSFLYEPLCYRVVPMLCYWLDYVTIWQPPPTHPVSKRKHLAIPTHPPFWLRNIWMVPYQQDCLQDCLQDSRQIWLQKCLQNCSQQIMGLLHHCVWVYWRSFSCLARELVTVTVTHRAACEGDFLWATELLFKRNYSGVRQWFTLLLLLGVVQPFKWWNHCTPPFKLFKYDFNLFEGQNVEE